MIQVVLGLVGEIPAYCPDDVRHEEGASTVQALIWNRRTCRSGILGRSGWGEGVLQAAETVRSRVPIRSTGADRPIVVRKFL
jgi:hypothetical protein